MKKLIFLIASVAFAQVQGYVLNPITGKLDFAGKGYTAPAPYAATVTAQTTLTVTAATHGQGSTPVAFCFEIAALAPAVDCLYARSSIGDIVFTWGAPFTGTVQIVGPGAGSGAAGNVVGPASATVGCLPYYSATTGKVIAGDCSNLFYDVANGNLGLGTAAPSTVASYRVIDLNGASGGLISLKQAGTAYGLIYANSGGLVVSTPSNLPIQLLSNGSERARIATTSGNLLLATTTDLGYNLHAASFATNGNLYVYTPTAVTGVSKAVVRAGAGQSSTNLMEWQNNAGTAVASVGSAGALSALSVTSSDFVVAAAASYLGLTNRFSLTAPSDGVLLLRNWAGSDIGRVQFGGLSSAFPSLKRSGTTLQFRLADDSGFSPAEFGIPKFSGTNTTGAGSALLGTNSPASTLTAPYTWVQIVTADGSTAYIPAWK